MRGDWRLETGDWRLETRDQRLETGDWRLETRDWRLETGRRGPMVRAGGVMRISRMEPPFQPRMDTDGAAS